MSDRLSFVTLSVAQIHDAVARLAEHLRREGRRSC